MIGLIRCTETGEFLCMSHPVKFTGIYDRSAKRCAMPVHVFCCGMGHNIRTPLNRSAVDRCRKGVVHDQRYTMAVCRLCKLPDVENCQCRVCNSFSEYSSCIFLKGCIQLFLRTVRRNKGCLHAHLFHGHIDQVEGTSINGRGSHDMAARLTDIEQGKEIRCLS